MANMYEAPDALLARLRLGREEFCQRLLTMLIVGGEYPKWNTLSTPTSDGRAFLDRVYARSFGRGAALDGCVFVDEFDLPRRNDAERGGAPDYAVITDEHLWLIELKTEKASHRHDQVPMYFELGHHHHPHRRIEITYLTPAMSIHYEPPGDWAQFGHLTWADIAEDIAEQWYGQSDDRVRAIVERLLSTIGKLDSVSAKTWRSQLSAPASPAPPEPVEVVRPGVSHRSEPVAEAMRLAELTASDGRQRALEYIARDLDELQGLRLIVRDAICASAPISPLRNVRPWLWQLSSTGAPMTSGGRETGYELRLSRYERPVC